MPEPSDVKGRRPDDELAKDFEKFTYIVSHDLHAPLRQIKEFTRLLVKHLEGRLDEREQEYANMLTRSVENAQAMLDGLLQYSRISTLGKPFGSVDCHAVVQAVIHKHAPQIEVSGANVTIEGALPEVYGDAAQIQTVFANLIDNAIKFRSPDIAAEIRVKVQPQAEAWLFSIQDNGLGIHPDHHQAIFDIFRRLHAEDDYPGQGMGLALARKIVTRHGGTIGIMSEPGKGTTVRFLLPAMPGSNMIAGSR